MKRPLVIITNCALILAAVSCAIGALISAFSFNSEILSLLPYWGITVLVLAVSVTLLRGKGMLIPAVPALALFIWKLPEITQGAKLVAFNITYEYGKWLRIPLLFSDADATVNELTLFFAAAGIILAFALAIPICLRHSVYITALLTAPIVFLTFVLVDTTPDNNFLIGLLAVYLTLLICGGIHPDDFVKRGRNALPALALAILLLGAAYLAAPPDSYRRGSLAESIDNYLRAKAEQIGVTLNKTGFGWPNSLLGQWSFNTERVSIADAGSRTITNTSLLEINSTHTGTFYLRGYSMRDFSGREWTGYGDTGLISGEFISSIAPARIAEQYSLQYPDAAPDMVSMTIKKTGDSSAIMYTPYYSPGLADDDTVNFYYVKNSVLGLNDALTGSRSNPYYLFEYNTRVRAPSEFTLIDDSTAEGLLQLALEAGIDPDAERAEIADKVAEYISSSARYTLRPYIIPEGEDFALYFLQTAKMGYCIHFATAAVLMLRALDIPARFTSGFVVTVPVGSADRTLTVTDRNAHSWVEVYYDDIGWIPLEVTPSSQGSGIPAGTPHTAGPELPEAAEQPEPFDDTFPEDLLDPDGQFVPPPRPGTGGNIESQESSDSGDAGRTALMVIVYIVACAAGFVLLLIVRRYAAIKRRDKRFDMPDTNEAVLQVWKYAVRLSKPQPPPEEMEAIALKARFSLHRITEEERNEIIEQVINLAAKLYKQPNRPARIWLKYIRGL